MYLSGTVFFQKDMEHAGEKAGEAVTFLSG